MTIEPKWSDKWGDNLRHVLTDEEATEALSDLRAEGCCVEALLRVERRLHPVTVGRLTQMMLCPPCRTNPPRCSLRRALSLQTLLAEAKAARDPAKPPIKFTFDGLFTDEEKK